MNLISIYDKSLFGFAQYIEDYEKIDTYYLLTHLLGYKYPIHPLANPLLSGILVIMFYIILINLLLKNKSNIKDIFYIFLGTNFLYYSISFVLDKPQPGNRVLVPLVPLLLLAINEGYISIRLEKIKYKNYFLYLCLTLISFTFLTQFRFDDTYLWSPNRVYPDKSIEISYDPDGNCFYERDKNPADQYYQLMQSIIYKEYCHVASGKVISK